MVPLVCFPSEGDVLEDFKATVLRWQPFRADHASGTPNRRSNRAAECLRADLVSLVPLVGDRRTAAAVTGIFCCKAPALSSLAPHAGARLAGWLRPVTTSAPAPVHQG